ncbi:hypothetical protein GE061_019025 [Apolygus lucorum]|uniref:Uncharacterized protein n=1 Tax=Apolygus lucorum TaxID=248454 RepID=A0A6A4JXC7_APOLU|nr:hypothetical protein GE061_019025 [Apolygus lucorum]
MAESTSGVGNYVSSVEKLKGRENYISWRFQLKNILKHDGIWCCIEGFPVGDTTDAKTKARMEEKALSKINLALDKSAFPYVMQAKTAKEAWDALQTAFEDKGLNRRLCILRALCSLKLQNFKSMEAYVNEAMSLKEQLAATGKPIEDEFLAAVMLQGLPSESIPETPILGLIKTACF